MIVLGEMADFAQKLPPLAFSAVGLIVIVPSHFGALSKRFPCIGSLLNGLMPMILFTLSISLSISLSRALLASSAALLLVLKYSFCFIRIKETLSKKTLCSMSLHILFVVFLNTLDTLCKNLSEVFFLFIGHTSSCKGNSRQKGI